MVLSCRSLIFFSFFLCIFGGGGGERERERERGGGFVIRGCCGSLTAEILGANDSPQLSFIFSNKWRRNENGGSINMC